MIYARGVTKKLQVPGPPLSIAHRNKAGATLVIPTIVQSGQVHFSKKSTSSGHRNKVFIFIFVNPPIARVPLGTLKEVTLNCRQPHTFWLNNCFPFTRTIPTKHASRIPVSPKACFVHLASMKQGKRSHILPVVHLQSDV